MVDNVNPSSQFHPYNPPDVTPQSERSTSGLGGMLNNLDWRGGLNKARAMARSNPSAVLGGLAALVIGAGLMRRRTMR